MKINCINFSFSAHLHYMQTAATSQGDELGMKYWNPFDKINMIRTRQVILTRQTTSHSGLALSETDWEVSICGFEEKESRRVWFGILCQEIPKRMGKLQLLVSHQHESESPLLTAENNMLVSITASHYLLLHMVLSSLTAPCLGIEVCSHSSTLPYPAFPSPKLQLSFQSNQRHPTWGKHL